MVVLPRLKRGVFLARFLMITDAGDFAAGQVLTKVPILVVVIAEHGCIGRILAVVHCGPIEYFGQLVRAADPLFVNVLRARIGLRPTPQ